MLRAQTRVGVGLLLIGLLWACQHEAKLDRFGQLPQFSLQNQFGKTFSDSDLRGRVVVVDFIFTSCPDVCPLLTEQLGALRKRMPVEAPLSFVSFSVDPEHDTPERLRAFAQQHGVAVDHFWFLTGPIAEVKRVVTLGFKQAMQAEPIREGQPRNVLHGTHFVLVDQRGEIRGFFANDKDGHEALQKAVSSLLARGADS
ncbi:MAG TPA: SCO family protein [Polyangiales bacterium]|nr:SCO family protein [Polyangiales bacterium]